MPGLPRTRPRIRRRTRRELLLGAGEMLLAISAATIVIALLQSTAPPSGLGVLYLLAVLALAIRRGQLEALVTAVLCMLVLNFLFIAPRHRLAIAHSQDVVELAVLLIAAVLVGRLAAAVRQEAAEAERRAVLASRREREAKLLAEASSAILAGPSMTAQLQTLGERLACATAASGARVGLEPVPAPRTGELAMPLRARSRRAWLYVSQDTSWEREDLERIAEPLGRLIDVAVEREVLADQSADAEATKRAEVARTAVLHAISHDLRSPLTAIATAASALHAPVLQAAERNELVEVIEGEAARLAGLVDDLLDISRIEAGAVAPRADWCDLQDVVSTAAGHLRTEHPIDLTLPPELPLIRADAAQLERVFCNLIENAVKFSPPDTPVRITAACAARRVTVRVIDQGRGIPAGQRGKVFEPFFRGRGQPGSGSGLGLAICRGFVEANGGQITLLSAAGPGTSFAVSFPVVRQPESQPHPAP